ncbi:hypothetical protein JRO89_XS12G0224400 [Xanthoceras sorbifolium]|uniref:Glycosyltransferase N-terminal domain-containing protein n=1 Tax=Xanthoceras sorbifolium TaxID=99658 RepID=A0ABQ8HDD7_9ROSI|nr:hypothetical protein JRO89_XS12G0224400 [Xanthoceras sorbifolium]
MAGGNPHVLVIPYPAQGHVIPLMELSQCLARHGIRITFVNTEQNHKRVMNALAKNDGIANSYIHLVSVLDGLESDPKQRNQPEKRLEAVLWFLPRKVEELIENINASESDKITCVLADHLLGWAMEIAVRKGIKRAAFSAIAATTLVLRSSIPKLIDDGIIDNDGTPTKKQMFRISPTMPAMTKTHLGWTSIGNKKLQKMYFENIVRDARSMNMSDWVLCNSTYDLEPAAFNMEPKIRPIGPLLASNRLGDLAGNFWPEDLSCLKWLDQQPPQSVMYVAFGSSTDFDRIQFQEVAMGLEICNRPFLWVVRPDTIDKMTDAYPSGFQERVAARGNIVSWAPQQKVLGHPAVACFVSHCGWNSTIEGVSNGIPFLCWPYFADQFHNESNICDVWKVGLGFNRDENGIVTQEQLKNKVEELLGCEKYKANALNLKEKMINGIKEGGGSYNNFKNFVKWVKA